MKLETFFNKFDQFADAPDVVAKMRELVLHLAVTGKLSEHLEVWTESPLGEVARLRRGYDLPTQDRKMGLVPIFAANGPVGEHDIHKVKAPGVVTGRSGSIGKVHFVDKDFWPLNTSLYVEDFLGNYPRFICLLLRSLHLERFSTATAVPTLNRNVVHKEIVKVPPVAEQKRIVAKVDELMALCDRLEAQLQERTTQHAALARATLARFVDAPTPVNLRFLFHSSYTIEPADLRKSILTLAVQGKLVPQDPNDEPAFVSEGSQFDGAFDIPENWAWNSLAELQPEFQNGASSRGDKDGTPVTVIRLADVANRRISLDDPREIAISIDQIAKYRLQPGDTLITRVNGSADIVGTFIPVQEALDAIYCDHFIRMRINPERLLPAYIALVGDSQLVREQIRSLFISTAGQKTVNQGHIRSLRIPIPPLAEQRRIVAKVQQLMTLVDALETQLAASCATAANLLSAIVAELTGAANSAQASVPSAPIIKRRGRPRKP